MTYKEIAQKVLDDAIEYIEKSPDQKFGAAQIAIKAIGALAQANMTNSVTLNATETLKWQSEMLDKISKACEL